MNELWSLKKTKRLYLFLFLFYFLDVGYGNYVLTAPVERNRRNTENGSNEPESDKSESNKNVSDKSDFVEKFEVPELMSPANTLTNPNAKKKKIEL